MNLQQAAKLIASQNLRIKVCEVEIAQLELDCLDDESKKTLLEESKNRLTGLQSELAGLLSSIGGA